MKLERCWRADILSASVRSTLNAALPRSRLFALRAQAGRMSALHHRSHHYNSLSLENPQAFHLRPHYCLL
jgi:hypothetical protein